jgi:hypothetical protein
LTAFRKGDFPMMPRDFTAMVLALGFAATLAACSSSSPALTCSDPKTTDAVIKVAKEDLIKKVGHDVAMKTEMTISAIRATGDKDGRYECAGVLDAKFPADTRIPEAKLPITYVSEHHETGPSVKVHGL